MYVLSTLNPPPLPSSARAVRWAGEIVINYWWKRTQFFIDKQQKKRKANRAICEYIGSDIICGQEGAGTTIKVVLGSEGSEKEGMDGLTDMSICVAYCVWLSAIIRVAGQRQSTSTKPQPISGDGDYFEAH